MHRSGQRKESLGGPRAGLVPFTFSGALQELCKRLSGLSCEVIVSNDRAAFREDLLFTHRGLSGPALLQLSSYWSPGESIRIDLLPGQDGARLLQQWKEEQPRTLLRTMLSRQLPNKLVRELEELHWPEIAEQRLANWPDRRLQALATRLQAWELKPAATEGYRTAEVTLGGVDTRGLSSKTMESNF